MRRVLSPDAIVARGRPVCVLRVRVRSFVRSFLSSAPDKKLISPPGAAAIQISRAAPRDYRARGRACIYLQERERERERWRMAKKTAAGCCRRLLYSHTRMCAREWKESNTAGIMPFDAFSPDRTRAPSLALVTRRLVVIFN